MISPSRFPGRSILSALVLALACTQALAQAPAPASRPAPPPRGAVIPRPSLESARKALDAAVASATQAGASLSCAVVDVHGDLVAFVRMDDAAFLTVAISQGKALASALFGRPSAELSTFGQSPFFAGLNASMGNRLIPAQGAVPILRDKRVIGAIGCSGGAPQQDEAAAQAGLAVF